MCSSGSRVLSVTSQKIFLGDNCNSVKFRRKYLEIFFSILSENVLEWQQGTFCDQSEKVTHATAVPCTQHLNTLEDTKIHKKNMELHCNTLSSRVLLSYVADSRPHSVE